MGDGHIIFRQGRNGTRKRKKCEDLLSQDIFSTRYVGNACLHRLGIYNNVYYLVWTLGLQDLFERRHRTYVNLTQEFLSSLIYSISPNTVSTAGTIKFRMFNVEYKYTTDQIAELLKFPHGEGVPCVAPIETDWAFAAGTFWQELIGFSTNTFKGNLALEIHTIFPENT